MLLIWRPFHLQSASSNGCTPQVWFDQCISTNIAKRFLCLVDKHFAKHHPYHKFFNRNTVKVSYSCMPNMAAIISSHDTKMPKPDSDPNTRTCSCRNKSNAHLKGTAWPSALCTRRLSLQLPSQHNTTSVSQRAISKRATTRTCIRSVQNNVEKPLNCWSMYGTWSLRTWSMTSSGNCSKKRHPTDAAPNAATTSWLRKWW